MRQRGFTLLEVLVATVIMGIAVVGLLAAISTSMRNAAHVTDADRAAVLARGKMNELLANPRLPWQTPIEGVLDASLISGRDGGWRALVTPFEVSPNPAPGGHCLERIQLQIWWNAGGSRRTFALEAYRAHVLLPREAEALAPKPER